MTGQAEGIARADDPVGAGWGPVFSRRGVLGSLLAAAAMPGPLRAQADPDGALTELLLASDGMNGSFDGIAALARRLARDDDRTARAIPSGLFAGLDYDAYRAIRPRTLPLSLGDGGFRFEPMPPGHIYADPAALSVIEDGVARPLRFDPALFEFDPSHFDPEAVAAARGVAPEEGLGFSGFRLRAPFNRPDAFDEFAVFHGASYFRAVSRGLLYGLSARGLAIDTAAAEGEEFPRFTRFWIERPAPEARDVVVRALLESRSCTGAYEFVITPSDSTTMDIRCRLFPRAEIARVGLAPLTSMYFFGPARRAGVDDFRDAVHDSSGLQMITGDGRRLWRSLSNPSTLQVSSFSDRDPKGFGLVQRQRAFGYYQDDEARYDKRPSCWIEPVGDWGAGSVMLVEIPVDSEFHDNIVAFWRPDAPLAPAEDGHDFAYRAYWSPQPPDGADLGRVVATRSGAAVNAEGERTMVVDFEREAPWPADLRAVAHAMGEPLGAVALRPLPGNGGVRASFGFVPGDRTLIELDLTLVGPDGPASETWMYRWTSA